MKQVLIGLGTITGLATIVTAGLFLADYPTIAAIIGTSTVALWLVLIVVSTVAIASWWSANLMERGATLALRSQESDDKRDVALVKTLGSLARRDLPALPMPSQTWLPQLSEFVEGEVEDVS